MNINITKQQWTIIGVVVAIIAVWYFFLRKKKAESGYYAVLGTDGGETGYAGQGSGLLEMPESNFRVAGFDRRFPAGTYTGTGVVASATADCMSKCRAAGFGYAPCKARCSGGASTSM